jgi:nitrate reductase NapE component
VLTFLATLLSIALIAALVLAAFGVVAWAFNLLAGLFAPPATDADIDAALAEARAELARPRRQEPPAL